MLAGLTGFVGSIWGEIKSYILFHPYRMEEKRKSPTLRLRALKRGNKNMKKRKRRAKAGTPDGPLDLGQLSFDLGELLKPIEINIEPLELPDLSIELPRIDPVTLPEINLDLDLPELDLKEVLAGLQIGAELPDLTGGNFERPKKRKRRSPRAGAGNPHKVS